MTVQDRSARSNLDYLNYCKQVANGRLTTKHGRPVTEFERLECQHVLNQKAAIAMQATTLHSLLNGVHIDDVLKTQVRHPELSGAWMSRQEEKTFMSIVAADIASGRLVVRSLVHLLRCNDSSEVKELVKDPEHPGWFAVSIRLVVTDEDAKAWLAWHKKPTPDWLDPDAPLSQSTEWAANDVFKSHRRRKQVEIIERLIRELGFDPLCIPDGEKSVMRAICIERHKEYFTLDSFENCWGDLSEARLVRVEKYDIYHPAKR